MNELAVITSALRVETLARRLHVVMGSDAGKGGFPNANYASQIFLRAAQLQSVGNGFQQDLEKKTQALENELVAAIKTGARSITKLILQSGTRLIIDAFAGIKHDLTVKMDGLAKTVHERNVAHLAEHHEATARGTPDFAGIVDDTPILGTTLAEQLDKLASDTIFRFKAAVRTGVSAGDNTEQLIQRVTGEGKHFDIAARDMLALNIITAADPTTGIAADSAADAAKKRLLVQVRLMDSTENSINKVIQAAITAFANVTDSESADSVDTDKNLGWQWLAVQDANVCPQCEFYDGSKWDAEGEPVDDGPEDPGEPPLHMNCRCSKVPIDLDAKEVPQDMNFDDYLSQFSRSEQEAAFGKQTLRAYQRGDITAAGLMGQKENMMTLEAFKNA